MAGRGALDAAARPAYARRAVGAQQFAIYGRRDDAYTRPDQDGPQRPRPEERAAPAREGREGPDVGSAPPEPPSTAPLACDGFPASAPCATRPRVAGDSAGKGSSGNEGTTPAPRTRPAAPGRAVGDMAPSSPTSGAPAAGGNRSAASRRSITPRHSEGINALARSRDPAGLPTAGSAKGECAGCATGTSWRSPRRLSGGTNGAVGNAAAEGVAA